MTETSWPDVAALAVILGFLAWIAWLWWGRR